MKYTIKNFQEEFNNDDVCLDYIFNQHYGKKFKCPGCEKKDCFYRVKKRKSYACSWCGHQVNPTAGTIFHKSSTKLTLWFYAIFLVSQSKNGVSGKELERHLGVTYKTAWRMAKQIRQLMSQGSPKGSSPEAPTLSGTVEADETYMGGKKRGKRGRGAGGKAPVFGVVERKGNVKAKAVSDVGASTLLPLLRETVEIGSNLMTDEWKSYNKAGVDFNHQRIKHSAKEYVRDNVHTNTIEGFWSQLKRSIDGTYHQISRKYLQSYVDEFAFRYNHRSSSFHLFEILLGRI